MKLVLLLLLLIATFITPASPQERFYTIKDKSGNDLVVEINARTGSAHRITGSLPNIGKFGYSTKSMNQTSAENIAERLIIEYSDM
jgi:hypothetical protein